MPILSNPKHEAFAQALGLGSSVNQTDAAKLAGFGGKGIRNVASRLYGRPEIRARIDELHSRRIQQVVTTAVISKQWVLDELMDTYRAAKGKENLNVARLTLVDIGTELGMFVKKTETKLELPTDIAQFSEAQLLQLQHWLERMRYGNDEQAILDMRRRTGVLDLEAVDVVPSPAEPEKEQDGW